MKRIITIVLMCGVVVMLSGCGNKIEDLEYEGYHRGYDIAYIITRARVRKDNKMLKKYIPDIIEDKDGKEKYMEKLKSIVKYNIKTVGLEYIKYNIMNSGERKELLVLLEEEYGIDEEYVEHIEEMGYLTFDIKYNDYNGKDGTIKEKNILYKYKNEYYIIIHEESKKGE